MFDNGSFQIPPCSTCVTLVCCSPPATNKLHYVAFLCPLLTWKLGKYMLLQKQYKTYPEDLKEPMYNRCLFPPVAFHTWELFNGSTVHNWSGVRCSTVASVHYTAIHNGQQHIDYSYILIWGLGLKMDFMLQCHHNGVVWPIGNLYCNR